jgi:hypothetical protein
MGSCGLREIELTWVDPRTDPSPSAAGRPARTTDDPDESKELVDLCKKGRLYSVERWIAAGKPLQGGDPKGEQWRHRKTPLILAIESQQHDLALLLLCNGYQMGLEPRPVLDLALRNRAWDFVELLTAWGADPEEADPYTVLDTYQSSLMERFWDAGVDFTRHNCLADYLSTATRNKPAYGWARRHNDDGRVAYQLALALGDAVFENAEKAALLLLWAGADPHRKVPSLRWGSGIDGDPDEGHESAIEVAVQLGHGNLLRHLKPDPGIDDFEELYAQVCDPDTLDHLSVGRPPADWSQAIARNAWRMSWWLGNSWESRRCLERIFENHGGRLSRLEHRECQEFRRSLLKIESDSDLSWLLRKLAKPHYCDAAIFAELTRTPAIRKRMEGLRLGRLLPDETTSLGPKRKEPTRRMMGPHNIQERDQGRRWDPENQSRDSPVPRPWSGNSEPPDR